MIFTKLSRFEPCVYAGLEPRGPQKIIKVHILFHIIYYIIYILVAVRCIRHRASARRRDWAVASWRLVGSPPFAFASHFDLDFGMLFGLHIMHFQFFWHRFGHCFLHRCLLEHGSQTGPFCVPFSLLLVAIFRASLLVRSLDTFSSSFGSLSTPFASLWLPLWGPSASIWLPFGSLRLPFDTF